MEAGASTASVRTASFLPGCDPILCRKEGLLLMTTLGRTCLGVVVGLLLLAGILPGCVSSSATFVAKAQGYAVTRGQCVKVVNLHSQEITPLKDGVALKIDKPGCKVTLQFDGDKTQVLELAAGSILVHGKDGAYVLEPHATSD